MAGGEEHFDQIATAATDVSTAAEDFGDSLDTLAATIGSESPWGADGPGSVFGMAYTALLGHAVEVLESHWGMLAEGAVKLDNWSGNSRATEDGNQQVVDNLGTQLDGVEV